MSENELWDNIPMRHPLTGMPMLSKFVEQKIEDGQVTTICKLITDTLYPYKVTFIKNTKKVILAYDKRVGLVNIITEKEATLEEYEILKTRYIRPGGELPWFEREISVYEDKTK